MVPRFCLLIAAFWFLLPLSRASATDPANTWILNSGVTQISLLELYTSQGCYSCPPAEHWLNALLQHPDLWHKVVPVALHVDYWDYLGWPDPYGDKRNQERHYAYKKQGHTRAIYTPEIILNGRDYTIWRKGEYPRFHQDQSPGELEVSREDNGIKVYFQRSQASPEALRATVALLGFGIKHDIKAGENKGKRLAHEFVVLTQHIGIAHPVGKLYLWKFPKLYSEHTRERSAIVAWLDRPKDNRPIQAVGGWADWSSE